MLTLNNMNSRPSFRVVRGATLLVALIAIAILGSSSCTQPTSEVSNGNAPANSNNAAPANKPSGATSNLKELPASAIDAELKTLDGKTLRLADYKGKVVVLDLWATWCGPCRQEIPHLVALRNDYAARGVEVIGLTIEDPETTIDDVRDFSEEFKINYPVGFADETFTRSVARAGAQGVSIPQTLILTKDGRVLKHFVGINPQTINAQLRQAVDQAISIS
ncbi:MAG: TlpA disulfide reductase family protein [Pyrinomonadaceae bacterium]